MPTSRDYKRIASISDDVEGTWHSLKALEAPQPSKMQEPTSTLQSLRDIQEELYSSHRCLGYFRFWRYDGLGCYDT